MVLGIVLLAGIVVAIVLAVIEQRIIRKPVQDRTDRERRFIASDQQATARWRWYRTRVSPVFGALVSLALIGLGIAGFAQHDARLGVLPVVLGAVFLVGFVLLFVFRARLSRPVPILGATPDGSPDTTGSYGRPRLAVGFGLVFVVGGVAAIAGPWRSDVGRYGPFWLTGLILVLGGGTITVIAILQLLRRRRAAAPQPRA